MKRGALDKKVMALPRYAHANEVAAMVAYLAGPEAGFVTGASLTMDGGTHRLTAEPPAASPGVMPD